MSEPKCPKCGGRSLFVERRPNGDAQCFDCRWLGKYAECFKLDPITQPLASMQQRIAELENERKVQDVRIKSCERIMSDLEQRFDRERERRIEAEKALSFYLDEGGGPYAPGDHHSADGGQRAREYFEKWGEK